MLQFILGTGGTGKTALIHKKIEELVRGGEQVFGHGGAIRGTQRRCKGA